MGHKYFHNHGPGRTTTANLGPHQNSRAHLCQIVRVALNLSQCLGLALCVHIKIDIRQRYGNKRDSNTTFKLQCMLIPRDDHVVTSCTSNEVMPQMH